MYLHKKALLLVDSPEDFVIIESDLSSTFNAQVHYRKYNHPRQDFESSILLQNSRNLLRNPKSVQKYAKLPKVVKMYQESITNYSTGECKVTSVGNDVKEYFSEKIVIP